MELSLSVPEIAWAAISAGHEARHHTPKEKEDREETPLALKPWRAFVDRKQIYEEDALGARTPLVCLYFLGWCMGTSKLLLSIALLIVSACWTRFWMLSMKKDHDGANFFWEMWVANIAVLFLYSACFFVGQVSKRIPRQIPRSGGFWVAILLETCLANTLTCVAHGLDFGLLKGGVVDVLPVRLAAFSCPFVLWFRLRKWVVARQDAFIKRNNLAARGGRETASESFDPSREADERAGEVITSMITTSMGLEMTGLSIKNLDRLADDLGGEPATLIRFYTASVDSREDFHRLLGSFDQGYECARAPAFGRGSRKWCREWMDRSGYPPWESVRQLADSREPPEGAPEGRQCSRPKDRIWWLCGAIARVSDQAMGTRHRQYALMAAALSANQDPLAIIMAGGRATEERLRKMKEGCAEVLRQVDPDQLEERGVMFTDAKEGDSPVVTYSPSEAWHVASVRGAFILGKHAFDLLWKEPPRDCVLLSDEKNRLRETNDEWSSRVETRVDLKPLFEFLGLRGITLANVVAAGKLGYWMHFAWVVCAIITQPFFPHHLPYLATMASLFVPIGGADLCAHVVFVAVHLGCHLPTRRLCRIFKPMSDDNIKVMAWNSFVASAVVVNWGSAFLGQRYAKLFDKAAFWVLLLVPLLPGLWYFELGGRHHHVIKSDKSGAVVIRPARKAEGQGGRNARTGSWEGSSREGTYISRLQLGLTNLKTRGMRRRSNSMRRAASYERERNAPISPRL